MNTKSVVVDRTSAVATIRLETAALTYEAKVALHRAVAGVAQDPSVRAVVLAGSDKAFCLGQDLAEHETALADGAEAAFSTVRNHYSPIIRELMTMAKPVMAAVTGACVGAGLGLALACDYRVFGDGVKLGTAFTGIGLTFDSGLSFTLPQAIGSARARELMLFGTMITAEQAIEWGVAGEIVPAGEVLDRSMARARELAQGPTVAFAETKKLLLDQPGRSLDAVLEAEAAAQTRCGATSDHAGAVAAFLSRGRPTFGGS